MAEKLAALKTAKYFAQRAPRGDLAAALATLSRADGQEPAPEDQRRKRKLHRGGHAPLCLTAAEQPIDFPHDLVRERAPYCASWNAWRTRGCLRMWIRGGGVDGVCQVDSAGCCFHP